MARDPFIHKQDATKKMGIFPLTKLVACFRYLCYGSAFDSLDENLQIGESTLEPIVKQFCRLVVEIFGPQYLNREPNATEKAALLEHNERRGFPGLLASWDCKHFNWKNCPMRLAGQHSGHAQGNTLILEAIADHRKYFWSVNFGDPGSLNDINVLDKSPIVGSLLRGKLDIKVEPYNINGKERDWMYFLVDGIYPDWAIFVTTYTKPTEKDKKVFAREQEKVRKDIECAFGILVQRFHILQRPLRQWYLEDLKCLLKCCIIIHNMVVDVRSGQLTEVEANDLLIATAGFPLFGKRQITPVQAFNEGVDLFAARSSAFDHGMQNTWEHFLLKQDLVAHINALNNN